MTREEKKHKLKLIVLILIVEAEKLRRKPPQTIQEALTSALEMNHWHIQFRIIQAMPYPKFKKGGVTHSNRGENVILS